MDTELEIVRGATLGKPITVKRKDGTPVDISGYTFYFTVKQSPDEDEDDSTALIQKTWTTHTNPTAGETYLDVPFTLTDIAAGRYFYEIAYESPAGVVTKSGRYKFRVRETNTNRIT